MASHNSPKLESPRPPYLPSPRDSPFPSPNTSESSSNSNSAVSYPRPFPGKHSQKSPSISSPTNYARGPSSAEPLSKLSGNASPRKFHERSGSVPYAELGQSYPRPLQRYENNFQYESTERANVEPPATRKGSYEDTTKKTLGQKLKSIFIPRDEPKDPNCVRIESKHWTDE